MYQKPSGSWVAIPTPMNKDKSIDFEGFRTLVDYHVQNGTNMLFCMGSAGEATMMTLEERKKVVHEMVKICENRIPVYFGSTLASTEASVQFAKYAEAEGADGLIFPAPCYLLPPQTAIKQFYLEVMQSVEIPVGIYNNPSRTGINVRPETIEFLAKECPNFVVDKEAMPNVKQLVEVKRRLGDRLNLLCCDYPEYSIVIPTLALGGNGAANIGGNIIPKEMAKIARPWTSLEIQDECRELYFYYYDLLKELYMFSNPIVIKAALKLMGLSNGVLREPYQELTGSGLESLRRILEKYNIIAEYGGNLNEEGSSDRRSCRRNECGK